MRLGSFFPNSLYVRYYKIIFSILCYNLTDKDISGTDKLCTTSQRTQYVKDMCNTENQPFPGGGTRLIVDDNRKLMMCEISKSGCTSIRALWLHSNLNIGKNLTNITMKYTGQKVHHVQFGIKLVASSSVSTKYNGYTKFIIVRNPFDRLVSAYYNLINWKPGLGDGGPLVERVKQRYLTLQNNASNLSFEQFIDFVTDSTDPCYNNRHIAPYSTTCQPCSVQYDYILRLESFSTFPKNDALPILEKLGYEPDYLKLKQSKQNSNSRLDKQLHPSHYSIMLPQFRSVSSTLFKKILERYRLDLKLYGYDFDIKSAVASCSISTENDTCC